MLKNKMKDVEMEEADEMEEGEESEGYGSEDMFPKMDKKWQAECDANDLLRAAEIKKDEARYKAAMAMLSKKKAAIESIEDLKAAKKKAFTSEA